MRALLLCAIAIIIALLALQSYRLVRDWRHTERRYSEIIKKMAPLAADNATLQANLKALEAGRAAPRELRNAGYAAPGEKMLIIIPKQ